MAAICSASNVSDVLVRHRRLRHVSTQSVSLISSLRGAVGHAAVLGLNGYPLVRGRVVYSFLTGSVNGSLDGEFFRQDRLTVVAGLLPEQASTSQIVLTPLVARMFRIGVGGRVTYPFRPVGASGNPMGRVFTRSYRVAAVAEVPPALVDQTDEAEGAILPPGATPRAAGGVLVRHGRTAAGRGAATASRRLRAGLPIWPGRSSTSRKLGRTGPRSGRISRSTVPTSSMVRCSSPSGRNRLR